MEGLRSRLGNLTETLGQAGSYFVDPTLEPVLENCIWEPDLGRGHLAD